MDRGTWQATVHGIAKSQTRLSNFFFSGLLMRNCFCFLCLKQSLFCLHFKGYFYLVLNTKWTDHPHLPLSSTLKISVFPGGSDGKKSAYNVGDPSWIPGSGRSPGEGNGYPLQYSCLKNSTDRGARQVTLGSESESRSVMSNSS